MFIFKCEKCKNRFVEFLSEVTYIPLDDIKNSHISSEEWITLVKAAENLLEALKETDHILENGCMNFKDIHG